MNLKTRYLGLELKNPVIAASSKLTGSIEKIIELEKQGAAAAVLKSLFEEQIVFDTEKMLDSVDTSIHAEAYDLFSGSSIEHFMDEYLSLVADAKKNISIPVIPSINCVTDGSWIEYARKFEKAGAPALELNVFIQPYDVKKTSVELENTYLSIIKKIRQEISIPVAIKIGSYFTGLANFAKNIADEGADALVLFNRYYRADIDIDKVEITTGPMLSNSDEMLISLQWIALLSGKIKADLSATTGVHSWKDAVKLILAGADTVQLCSVLYNKGAGQIAEILSGLEKWMAEHNYSSLDDFRGILNEENSTGSYKRVQFIKSLVGLE